MTVPTLDEATNLDKTAIAEFLVLEARYADEHDYPAWESLWDDTALYWVPRDPSKAIDQQMSYIADNRARIHSRIAQLSTGARYAQEPQSKLRRQLSNFEYNGVSEGLIEVAANFSVFEYRDELTIWAGRYEYGLVLRDGNLRIQRKVVNLINAAGPIPTLAFLI